MKNRFYLYTILVLGIVLLSGCSVKIDLNEYKPVPTQKITIEHPQQIKLHLSEITSDNETLEKYLQKELSNSKLFDIVQHPTNNKIEVTVSKFDKYTQLISREFVEDKNGRQSYCDYKPYHDVTNNNYVNCESFKYKEDKINCYRSKDQYENNTNKCAIKGYWKDSYYKTHIYISVSVKVSVDGESNTFQSNYELSYRSEQDGFVQPIPKSTEHNLFKNLTQRIATKLKPYSIPKAYIVDMRVNQEDLHDKIFKINIGDSFIGIYSQKRCYIYDKNDNYIDQCTISNQIDNNSAWIVLDNEDKNNLIRIGYTVRFFRK